MTNHDDDRELQLTLRNVAAAVLIALFAFLVIAAVLVPVLTDEDLDTTLVLGLSASILGALPVMLGVQFALNRKNGGE